jgi:hypothetical protein
MSTWAAPAFSEGAGEEEAEAEGDGDAAGEEQGGGEQGAAHPPSFGTGSANSCYLLWCSKSTEA